MKSKEKSFGCKTMTLDEFFDPSHLILNGWLTYDGFEIYLRWNCYRPERIELANVHRPDPGSGKFPALLDELEKRWLEVKIENVHNEMLANHLIRRGYRMIVNPDPFGVWPASFLGRNP